MTCQWGYTQRDDTVRNTGQWRRRADKWKNEENGPKRHCGCLLGCSMSVYIYFYLIFLNNFVTSYKYGTTTNSHDHQHLTPLQHRAFALSKFFFFVSFHFTYIILRLLMTYHHHSRSQMRCGVVFCVYFLFLGQPLHWIKTITYHHHHHHWTTNFG